MFKLENLSERVNSIHRKALTDLEVDKDNFLRRLEEWGNGPNPYFKGYFPSVLAFVEKYLEWHVTSPETKAWKNDMFGGMIPQPEWGDGNVFGPLLHFLGYHVYDDGSFSVKWYKHLYKSELQEIEGKICEYPTSEYLARVETTPGDYKDAFPVLVDDPCGTQDPSIIVDAMLRHESNQHRSRSEAEREWAGQ